MMRFIIVAFFGFTLMACKPPQTVTTIPEPEKELQIIRDTITLRDTVYLDNPEFKALKRQNDSLLVVSDTLAKRLLHARLIIQNVKYYVAIVNRNPSQLKFLRGWLNRALAD